MNHSTCRRFGTAAATGACRAGAQCAEIVQVVRLGDGGAAEPPGVTAAPGDVQLQAVHHRAQPVDVIKVGGVLPGGHVAVHRRAHRGEAGEVVAGHGFLEPPHAEPIQGGADAARLTHGVAAVGIDHQVHAGTGQVTRRC